MTIEIVSYIHGLSNKIRFNLTRDLINDSKADVLLFCGHTLGFVNDIEDLKTSIENKHVEAILELEDINSDKIENCLYRISSGNLSSLNTNQIFAQSIDIEGNYELSSRLLHEFEHCRSFDLNGYRFLIIQCEELNILKNLQNDKNKVLFRLNDDKKLLKEFNQIIEDTKVILNPIHTPMGNQGKMLKRREYLSNKKRYYFSASNTFEAKS